jgi:hypothetical protein
MYSFSLRGHEGHWGGGTSKAPQGEDDMGSQEYYEEDSNGPCQVHEEPRGAMS